MGIYTIEGHRRLKAFLGWLSLGLCAIAMALVLIFKGTPYNPIWWLVMVLILAGAFVLPRALARPIEWVASGYLDNN